jgi:hypothetical protein
MLVVDLVFRSLNSDDLLTSGDRSLAFIGSTLERKVVSSRCEATSLWDPREPNGKTL